MNKQDFLATLTANNLDHHRASFEALMKDSIRYTLTQLLSYEGEPIDQSLIGGLPALPTGMEWPNDKNGIPLSFIAQLRLKDVKPFDTYDLLPDSGYLYFFYDSDRGMGGYSPDERHLFKVIYFDGEVDGLMAVDDYPENMTEMVKYHPCKLSFSNEISMPYKWDKKVYSFLNEEEKDTYGMKVWRGGRINRTLGHADNLQGTMETICQIVNSEAFDGDFKKFYQPENAELLKGEEDWVLLLQVDSNEDNAYMQWMDAGRLYFWIRKQDLLARNFDNCWCVMQDM